MSTFKTFAEFYPYYLAEHDNRICRRLHFIGSSLVLVLLGLFAWSGSLWYLAMIPLAGYGFAWVGHFVFEGNKPATFRHPFYSLLGDWKMFFQILGGKVSI
ncbi:MAG: DUF962 domain-containing protein [Pseudomonadota bacterium]